MVWILGIVTVLHVIPAVFWAGSTAVLARTGATNIEAIARPQMGSAVVAILMGAVLWYLNHRGGAGLGEHVLGAGAAAALLAAILQITALPRVRALADAAHADEKARAIRRALAVRQRIAGLLLVLAIIAMVTWRYF